MFSFSDLACFALYSSAYLAIAIASLLYMRKIRGIEERCEALEGVFVPSSVYGRGCRARGVSAAGHGR